MPKKLRLHFLSLGISVVLALLRWGLTRTRNVLTFWMSERKRPLPDRQRIDRHKAFFGLAAIVAGLGVAAWFLVGAFGTLAATALSRQTALYLGLALIVAGLQLVRFGKRVPGLVCVVLGVLLTAYGLGYIG